MARKIPLLKVDIEDTDDPLDYHDLMVQIVRAPTDPRAGAAIEEIRQSLLVLDALDEAEGQEYVVLEDAWWRTLRDKVKVFRFRFAHRTIADFVDAIENAETVKAAEVVDGSVAPDN